MIVEQCFYDAYRTDGTTHVKTSIVLAQVSRLFMGHIQKQTIKELKLACRLVTWLEEFLRSQRPSKIRKDPVLTEYKNKLQSIKGDEDRWMLILDVLGGRRS